MKDKYHEFFYKPDLEKLWNECDFVFDTNVFIDLYYNKNQANKFIEILETKIPNRIWLPYQIGLEYYRNRINAIKKLEIKYNTLINTVKGYKQSVKTSINNLSKSHLIDIGEYIESDEINENLDEIHTKILDGVLNAINEKADFFTDDKIMNKLNELYDGRTGDNYPENVLKEIYKEGEMRTKNKIPPAFEDKGHGDLILWKQIIDHAKGNNKSIIFVTSDSKRDWWFTTKDKEIIGPHPSLIKEFLATGQDFNMYRFSDFLRESETYLDTYIEEELIEEAREVEEIRDTAEELTERSKTRTYTSIPSIDPELLRASIPRVDPELLKVTIPRIDPELLRVTIPRVDPELLRATFPRIDPQLPNPKPSKNGSKRTNNSNEDDDKD